jgi:hypothetical protein
VARGPGAVAAALAGVPGQVRRASARRPASMQAWHLAGVPRIGAGRLLTLARDPGRGIPCRDENAQAQARRCQQLPPGAALIVLRPAARGPGMVAGGPRRAGHRTGQPPRIRRAGHGQRHPPQRPDVIDGTHT